jgi:hypothetical protein
MNGRIKGGHLEELQFTLFVEPGNPLSGMNAKFFGSNLLSKYEHSGLTGTHLCTVVSNFVR